MDKKQKILIVDDAKFNRDILKEILGDAYNYLEAENGNQVIQMIGDNPGINRQPPIFCMATNQSMHLLTCHIFVLHV